MKLIAYCLMTSLALESAGLLRLPSPGRPQLFPPFQVRLVRDRRGLTLRMVPP